MKPLIQAAVDSGLPPLELILDQPNRTRTRLDGILIKALYLEAAYELEGHPLWIEESPDISFRLRHRDVRSVAVVERAQKAESKKENPTPGRRFYVTPELLPGKTWPTRASWLKRRADGERPDGDELVDIKRIEEAEARAAEKAADDPEVAAIIAEFENKFNRGT